MQGRMTGRWWKGKWVIRCCAGMENERGDACTRVNAWTGAMAWDFSVGRCTQSANNGRRMRNNEVYKRHHNAGISETTSGLTTDYRQMRFSPHQIRALCLLHAIILLLSLPWTAIRPQTLADRRRFPVPFTGNLRINAYLRQTKIIVLFEHGITEKISYIHSSWLLLLRTLQQTALFIVFLLQHFLRQLRVLRNIDYRIN